MWYYYITIKDGYIVHMKYSQVVGRWSVGAFSSKNRAPDLSELRVSKFTSSQVASMLMCSRDFGGFVVDVEMRSVFWSMQGEDRVAGGAEGDGFCGMMERGEFHRRLVRIKVSGYV
jgi:hypothetical protein